MTEEHKKRESKHIAEGQTPHPDTNKVVGEEKDVLTPEQ